MDAIIKLANQHILEWESRLAHIDEMAERARELHGKEPEGSDLHKQLSDIKTYRQQLSLDLLETQNHRNDSSPTASPSEGSLHAALEATGLQLEQMLGSIVGADAPRRRKMDQAD
jgi:hypothetical protein